MKSVKISLISFIIFLLGTNISFAQSQASNLTDEQKQELAKNMEEFVGVLNLSEEQSVKFKELREEHFAQRREHWKSIRALKKQMMDALSTESPDTATAEDLANQIGILEAEKEKMLIDHYLKLQAECTPEQREKLADVFQRAMKRPRFHKKRKGKKKVEN